MDKNCSVEPIKIINVANEYKNIEMAILSIWGMCCYNCSARVRHSLLSLKGVLNVCIEYSTGLAGVTFIPELTTIEMLISTVAHAGNDGLHEYGAQLLSWEVVR